MYIAKCTFIHLVRMSAGFLLDIYCESLVTKQSLKTRHIFIHHIGVSLPNKLPNSLLYAFIAEFTRAFIITSKADVEFKTVSGERY